MSWFRDILGLSERERIGPYPLAVRVLSAGRELEQRTFANPADVADFVRGAYSRAFYMEPERRELRVEITIALDARDAVNEAVIGHLFAIQMGG